MTLFFLNRVPQVRILLGAHLAHHPDQRRYGPSPAETGEGPILSCPAVSGQNGPFTSIWAKCRPKFGVPRPGAVTGTPCPWPPEPRCLARAGTSRRP